MLLQNFLYLAQVLPIPIPSYRLPVMQRRILHFVWKGTFPQVAKTILHRPKLQGCLGLPLLYRYYQAAYLTQVAQW